MQVPMYPKSLIPKVKTSFSFVLKLGPCTILHQYCNFIKPSFLSYLNAPTLMYPLFPICTGWHVKYSLAIYESDVTISTLVNTTVTVSLRMSALFNVLP